MNLTSVFTSGHVTKMALHHSIRSTRKPHAARKHHGSMFDRTYGSSCRSKFYIAGIGIFEFRLLWPWSWPDEHRPLIPWRYAACANMNSYIKAFESYRLTDMQTRPKLHTTPLCGWPMSDSCNRLKPRQWKSRAVGRIYNVLHCIILIIHPLFLAAEVSQNI